MIYVCRNVRTYKYIIYKTTNFLFSVYAYHIKVLKPYIYIYNMYKCVEEYVNVRHTNAHTHRYASLLDILARLPLTYSV